MNTALATRCPACSTVFRVVPDQLRVSGGWVRCGRCAEVFDASESLLDMETGAPRLWAAVNRPAGATDAAATTATPGGPATAAPASAPANEPAAEPPIEAPASTAKESHTDLPSLADEPAAAPPGEVPALVDLPALAVDAAGDPPADIATLPAFVRRADRAERWRRPGVRAALAGAALLGVAGLAAQITWAYRDLAAARYPGLRPALEQGCDWLGCRIEAARAIDALAVESSGLLRVERSSIYRLSVALRNNAGIDVMLPALDLALTDTRGRLVSRKVLHAADLGAPGSTLGAGRGVTLQATLQTALPDDEPVAGYTIELFYP